MTSTAVVYMVLYAAALVFLIACVVRAVGYSRLPLHLRWELYPVPHEPKRRAEHGGSYFEAPDWWTQPKATNLQGDARYMFSEILFLKGLWEFRRRMWYRSYPFHLGLYLLIAAAATLGAGALLSLLAPPVWAGTVGLGFHYVYTFAGAAGAALTFIGAVALLVARVTDGDLRRYTAPGDVFNLLFFIATVGLLAIGYFLRPDHSLRGLDIVRGAVTFNTALQIPALLEIAIVLGALLTAYIPMTHMAHFIAKYFTYHAVRWDDEANRRDSDLERKIAEYLTYRPTWSAPHVGADGTKSWADIATTNPAQGGKK
jgi:nitrate reductase gamma subunit